MSAANPAHRDHLIELVRAGDRAALARAITLVESRRGDHQARAGALIEALMPHTGRAIRVGLTGVPGVGKSTLLDSLGVLLTAKGHRLAVLAVDPSSSRVGGSILGDKTRMARLANDPGAFVRPSPSAGALGGVAARTRESLLLCEAAGYDVVVVETVGIGQSEAEVAAMTDVFVVLMLPGAGDELQGIKKGVLELADIIAVNKAEGENAARAKAAAAEYRAALQILTPAGAAWRPPVLLISGLAEQGLDTLWEAVLAHRSAMQASGAFTRRRSAQQIRWAWKLVEERMRARLRQSPALRAEIPRIERELAENRLSAAAAADIILRLADFDG